MLAGLASWVAAPIYQDFKSEGYIVPYADAKIQGRKATVKPLTAAVEHGPTHEKMLRNLYDPLMHISHHVCMPSIDV